MRKILLLLVAVPAFLTGCTPVDTGFGESLRWDLAQQTVDPDPDHQGPQTAGTNGRRAAAATDRYQKGAVKEPATVTTSSGTSPR